MADYCQVEAFPSAGLFISGIQLTKQNKNALVIVDTLFISKADEILLLYHQKEISFKKCLFIESSEIAEDVSRNLELTDAQLIPFPSTVTLLNNQMSSFSTMRLVKNEVHDIRELPPVLNRLAGKSEAIQKLRSELYTFGRVDIPLIFLGPSGSGKSTAAQLVHEISSRKHQMYKHLYLPSIPESLIEAHLFGAEKGAYTGADETRIGILEIFNGGTVFFDEIAEISWTVQTKLLQFMDHKTYSRVGSTKERYSDIRIICATNADLEKLVEEGKFRADLFQRLKGKIIYFPNLESHLEDTEEIIQRYLVENKIRNISFSKESMEILKTLEWKGNVRDLLLAVELTCKIAEADGVNFIQPENLMFAG